MNITSTLIVTLNVHFSTLKQLILSQIELMRILQWQLDSLQRTSIHVVELEKEED